MPTYTKEAIASLFPEDDPPIIDGKPDFQKLQPLNRVLLANARAIPCIQGGNRGHQGLIQDPATYNALPNANPWVDPVNPPLQPNFPAGATAAARELILEEHRRNREECQTAIAVDNSTHHACAYFAQQLCVAR